MHAQVEKLVQHQREVKMHQTSGNAGLALVGLLVIAGGVIELYALYRGARTMWDDDHPWGYGQEMVGVWVLSVVAGLWYASSKVFGDGDGDGVEPEQTRRRRVQSRPQPRRVGRQSGGSQSQFR